MHLPRLRTIPGITLRLADCLERQSCREDGGLIILSGQPGSGCSFVAASLAAVAVENLALIEAVGLEASPVDVPSAEGRGQKSPSLIFTGLRRIPSEVRNVVSLASTNIVIATFQSESVEDAACTLVDMMGDGVQAAEFARVLRGIVHVGGLQTGLERGVSPVCFFPALLDDKERSGVREQDRTLISTIAASQTAELFTNDVRG